MEPEINEKLERIEAAVSQLTHAGERLETTIARLETTVARFVVVMERMLASNDAAASAARRALEATHPDAKRIQDEVRRKQLARWARRKGGEDGR